jgi:hypothetical protein
MKWAMLFPAFLLGLSCSIHASHRGYSTPVRYRTKSLPHELERATGNLRYDAQYAFHARSRNERRAQKEINKLHKRARNLRRTVERRYGDERRYRKDAEKLIRQYHRTEDALRYVYVPRPVGRSMNQVRHLMSRLQRGYVY